MWWKSEILQEVLLIDLIFKDGEFTNLPFHIKLLLDNLQAAFILFSFIFSFNLRTFVIKL